MTIHPLTAEEQRFTGAQYRAVISYTDLAALTGGTGAQVINCGALAANMGAACVYAFLKTPFQFSDGTLLSNAVTLGDSGSAARYLASMETANAAVPATVKGGANPNPQLFVLTAADNFQATFTPTASKNLNTATAGEIHFYLIGINSPAA